MALHEGALLQEADQKRPGKTQAGYPGRVSGSRPCFRSTWNVILPEERRRIFAQDDSVNVVRFLVS